MPEGRDPVMSRIHELTASINSRVERLKESGASEPDLFELIDTLLEHKDDPGILELVEEILSDEEAERADAVADIAVQPETTTAETTMPYFNSAEELDVQIETAREIFSRDLHEAFAAVRRLESLFLGESQKKRDAHPEFVAKESRRGGKETIEGKEYSIGYYHIHHKPEEEVLGAALKLWFFAGDQQRLIPNDFYTEGGKVYEKDVRESLENITKSQNSSELIANIQYLFASGHLHDLLRIQFLLSSYYPDNKTYTDLVAPIEILQKTLHNVGIEVSTVPILDEISDSDHVVRKYDPGVLEYVPAIYQQVSPKVESARGGKKIAVDVYTFAMEYRFSGEHGDNKVILLSPSNWTGDDPTDEFRGVIY